MKEIITTLIKHSEQKGATLKDGYYVDRQLIHYYKTLSETQQEEFWCLANEILQSEDPYLVYFLDLSFSHPQDCFISNLESFFLRESAKLDTYLTVKILIVLNRAKSNKAAELTNSKIQEMPLQECGALIGSLFYSNRKLFLKNYYEYWAFLWDKGWTGDSIEADRLISLYNSSGPLKAELLAYFQTKSQKYATRLEQYLLENGCT